MVSATMLPATISVSKSFDDVIDVSTPSNNASPVVASQPADTVQQGCFRPLSKRDWPTYEEVLQEPTVSEATKKVFAKRIADLEKKNGRKSQRTSIASVSGGKKSGRNSVNVAPRSSVNVAPRSSVSAPSSKTGSEGGRPSYFAVSAADMEGSDRRESVTSGVPLLPDAMAEISFYGSAYDSCVDGYTRDSVGGSVAGSLSPIVEVESPHNSNNRFEKKKVPEVQITPAAVSVKFEGVAVQVGGLPLGRSRTVTPTVTVVPQGKKASPTSKRHSTLCLTTPPQTRVSQTKPRASQTKPRASQTKSLANKPIDEQAEAARDPLLVVPKTGVMLLGYKY